MMIQFKSLLRLAVTHAYYGGACRDFDFIAAADTRQRLGNGRLLAKTVAGALVVLYEADAGGAPLVPAGGQTLRFGLRLNNADFANITDVAPGGGSVRVYRNAAAPTALDAPLTAHSVGARFTHAISGNERPVTVDLSAPDGTVLRSDTVTAADTAAVSYVLSDAAAGLYTVAEHYAGNTATTAYYYDDELRGGCFAVVEIALTAGFYTSPPVFTIAFSARADTLKYYVVAKNYGDADVAQLSVDDGGFSADSRPQIQFDKVLAADFGSGDIAPSLLTDSDARVLLFKSQHAVARTEKAKTRIALNKNSDVLIPQLPQPGAGSSSADFILQITKQ